MIISSISPKFNNNYNLTQRQPNQRVSFTSGEDNKPKSKFFKFFDDAYDNATDRIAKRLGKIINNESVHGFFERTGKNKFLFNHLLTAGSVLLTSLYITRTLTNKSLDEDRRKTLAINQGIVCGVSAAMAYGVEGALKKKFTLFAKKFEAVNYKRMLATAITQKDKINNLKRLEKCSKGISIASKIVIFDTINRFIAPVFVTPIANKIGDRVNEKKKLEHK